MKIVKILFWIRFNETWIIRKISLQIKWKSFYNNVILKNAIINFNVKLYPVQNLHTFCCQQSLIKFKCFDKFLKKKNILFCISLIQPLINADCLIFFNLKSIRNLKYYFYYYYFLIVFVNFLMKHIYNYAVINVKIFFKYF